MVQVSNNSKVIKHHTGRGKNGRDSFDITLRWTRTDIKRFLQEYLVEICDYGLPNRFTDAEIVELFKTRLFELVPAKSAEVMANWAFDVSLRTKYITSNRWDKGSQTIYFIDHVILTLKPGRKRAKSNESYENTKRSLTYEQERD